MCDVSNARICWPHVPRALLKWCDFPDQRGAMRTPRPKEGYRGTIEAFLLMSGFEHNPNTGNMVCPHTRAVVLTKTQVWLVDINRYFKEYYHG